MSHPSRFFDSHHPLQRGVAQQLPDAEIKHDIVAAIQFYRVLADLEGLFRREHLDHEAECFAVRRAAKLLGHAEACECRSCPE